MSLGATAGLRYEAIAIGALKQIAYAENMYSNEHGSYGELTDLIRAGIVHQEWVDDMVKDNSHYDVKLTVDGDTFTVTARHKTRPDTRRAFQVGPDGEVKTLE